MLLSLSNRRGQNTAEYAIVIALIIGAVIAMQVYIKRGLQGRMKDGTDYMATETTKLGATKQYEPYYSDTSITTKTDEYDKTIAVKAGGEVEKLWDTDQVTTRTGHQEYKDTTLAD